MKIKYIYLGRRKIAIDINENRTKFKFHYLRKDSKTVLYSLLYNQTTKTVKKFTKCINGAKIFISNENQFKNSLEYERIIAQELSDILEDLENNVDKTKRTED